MIRILQAFILFGLFFLQYNAPSQWELAKQKDEILIYIRKVSFSDYNEFKGELIVKATPDPVIKALRRIDEYKNWLPDCLESRKLNLGKNEIQVNYVLTDVPWPFDDRDIIYEFKVLKNTPGDGEYQVFIENKPDYLEHQKGIVRIPKSTGLWIITPISESKTKLIYQMHVEPGGYVPAWLANLKITDTPYTFLFNLRQHVEN